MEKQSSGKFQFAIDRGGTFTDVFCRCPDGSVRTLKLLSEDPKNYGDAPTEGIRRILQQVTGKATLSDGSVDSSLIDWIRMGTTVATNALLERKGEKMALVINKGFKDLLYIGNQARPSIFQLAIQKPDVLYSEVVEVDCRVVPALRERCGLKGDDPVDLGGQGWTAAVGTTGEELYVVKDLNKEEVRKDLTELKKRTGINSIAVLLAHSYTYTEHELAIGKIAQELGFNQVSLSHQVMAMVRAVPRGLTACVDAYLTPHIRRYLNSFSQGFSDNLRNTNVLFMQSDGGLTPMDNFIGSRAILSGPAGGVVGYALTTYQRETDLPVIGFDMGGTSTDVSRYAGTLEHVHEATTAGVTIQAPQLDVNTVAAGGGSILNFRSGLFVVGPESCGARPGPACYGAHGPAAVTDANLVLGRLLPKYFPKIFGPNEDQPLSKTASLSEMENLRRKVNAFMMESRGHEMSLEEVAMGFVEVANEAMCRPIRALTTARGYDTSHHALACFGGAGGQHACSIARALGIHTVFVHKYAGILSAYGMSLADVVQEAQVPSAMEYSTENFPQLSEIIQKLANTCTEKLVAQGFDTSQIRTEGFLHMRYEGTDCALMCAPQSSDQVPTYEDFLNTFLARYQSEFGFTMPSRRVLVDDVRVRGSAKCHDLDERPLKPAENKEPTPDEVVNVYFEGGYQSTNVYKLEQLTSGHYVKGPAIIMDNLSTILVEPDCSAVITKYGDIKISVGSGVGRKVGTELDSIQLSIFSHRFMSIAEQMGRILQRTSISVNIKERLDFSCALFGPDGGLVSNAPHIPVHLGAMQETVKYQIQVRGGTLQEGDVILSNHPKAGGSHLPDFTVITPVFHKGISRPIFFVASRGHHADIGGITPGSMPPHSTSLSQEGAAFLSFLLVHQGNFREKELRHELRESRNLADNLSDLKAQIAANHRGMQLVGELIASYGLEVVQAYMSHIQSNAELAVRDMLKNIANKTCVKTNSFVLKAEDFMDDGTPIKLKIVLDPINGTATCDFTGTGVEVWGNCNAPRAITLSALIYCLRCMVGHDVPLNQGCLAPVKVIVPPGSILDPSEDAAVVGGNVLTSQRIVDVVFKAFQVCAASQGCMNNVTLGTEEWGYYETVAGGAGAGPGWGGASAVHTHMTNTRITDLEIIERRYPLILKEFSIRRGSGGKGKWHGGDGVRREILFRSPLTLSVLSERRAFAPYGMNHGENGERGVNHLRRKEGKLINLGGKTSVDVKPGDLFILQTPGGGGFGPPEDHDTGETLDTPSSSHRDFLERGSVYEYRKAQESV